MIGVFVPVFVSDVFRVRVTVMFVCGSCSAATTLATGLLWRLSRAVVISLSVRWFVIGLRRTCIRFVFIFYVRIFRFVSIHHRSS